MCPTGVDIDDQPEGWEPQEIGTHQAPMDSETADTDPYKQQREAALEAIRDLVHTDMLLFAKKEHIFMNKEQAAEKKPERPITSLTKESV